ncbi:MAG: DUF488 domain-containing protein [Alphaproteobacteria bacterium]|nr:DUF488 domain-containing protein [Alphaproteobacteria bacterium]
MATFTIGFTKTSAADFFARLNDAGVTTVIDVRLQNTSQLAGFAKAADLEFFLGELGGIGYRHAPELAPDEDLFRDYRKNKLPWEAFEPRFLDIMAERRIEEAFDPSELEGACLLCSEDTPHRCHRRLVVEYLEDRWGRDLGVTHL